MKLYIFIILILIISCNRQSCTIDKSYKRKFDGSIILIQKSLTELSKIQDVQKSVLFLCASTGIEPQNFNIENASYYDKASMDKDISKWRHWYQNNKCSMTIEIADSLLRAYNSPNPNKE